MGILGPADRHSEAPEGPWESVFFTDCRVGPAALLAMTDERMIFAEGAAPCGRPRAHAVRPYGNTRHRRARPLGAPRPAGSSGPTEYAPCRAFVMRVGVHLCVRPTPGNHL